MPLTSYHYAWLSKHPERDATWLKDKLREGFDVHHLDGDHSNDDPLNLILIEAGDHMGLHGMSMKKLLVAGRLARAAKPRPETRGSKRFALGKRAYELKTPSVTWKFVARLIAEDGPNLVDVQVRAAASAYAQAAHLTWPKLGSLSNEARKGMRCRDGVWMKAYEPLAAAQPPQSP